MKLLNNVWVVTHVNTCRQCFPWSEWYETQEEAKQSVLDFIKETYADTPTWVGLKKETMRDSVTGERWESLSMEEFVAGCFYINKLNINSGDTK